MRKVAEKVMIVVLNLSVLASTTDCLAGTVQEQAQAAVAVARAFLQLVDEHPQLPDTGQQKNAQQSSRLDIRLLTPNSRLQEMSREVKLPSDLGRDSRLAATSPMRWDFSAQHPLTDALPAQLVISTWERGCHACLRQEKDIRSQLIPLRWSVGSGNTDQIRFVQVPRTEAVPQIVLFQNGLETKRWTGYQDPALLSRELRAAWDQVPQVDPNIATGSGGSIHAGSQIKRAFSWWRQHVGEGVQANFRWERTGAEALPLFAKGDWSAKAIFGEYGRMNFTVDGATNLPLTRLGYRYRINGPDVEIDADPVTFTDLAKQLTPFGSLTAVNAAPSQFVDPLTAWSIISMLREIWQLLQPSCDLQLGELISANIRLTQQTMSIDFNEGPSVKLVALFTFHLRIQRVEISESSIRLIFSGSRLVKERTFQVQ